EHGVGQQRPGRALFHGTDEAFHLAGDHLHPAAKGREGTAGEPLRLEVLVTGRAHLFRRRQVHPELEARQESLLLLRHLRVDDPSPGRHPLGPATRDHPAVAAAVGMSHAPYAHHRDRLEPAVRMVGEAANVRIRIVGVETVEKEKGVEIPQAWLADDPRQPHTGTVHGRNAVQRPQHASLVAPDESRPEGRATPRGRRGGDQARAGEEFSAVQLHDPNLAAIACGPNYRAPPARLLDAGPDIEIRCFSSPARTAKATAGGRMATRIRVAISAILLSLVLTLAMGCGGDEEGPDGAAGAGGGGAVGPGGTGGDGGTGGSGGEGPRCGDGVVDAGEEGDDGEDNSDEAPGACRTDWRLGHCRAGGVDPGEGCDEGEANSDEDPGTCRTDCRLAHCGDGVVDPGEECDEREANSDEQPDACRTDCKRARCGDGVVDGGEACDWGEENSDEVPGA